MERTPMTSGRAAEGHRGRQRYADGAPHILARVPLCGLPQLQISSLPPDDVLSAKEERNDYLPLR